MTLSLEAFSVFMGLLVTVNDATVACVGHL